MFKPSVHNPITVGEEAFPNTINQPCSVSIEVQLPPGVSQQDAQAQAERVIARHQGRIWQFVAASRQMRDLGAATGQRRIGVWPGLVAELTFNYKVETLRLLVTVGQPPRSQQSQLSPPGEFDVRCPFIAFPYPGSTQNSGQPPTPKPLSLDNNGAWVYSVWPGVIYPFDFAASPSSPGPKSQVDNQTGYLKCASPVKEPDQNGSAQPLTSSPTTIFPYSLQNAATDQQFSVLTYTEDFWCKGVGGSGILTRPLSGKQYWEVKIIKLPTGAAPASYTTVRPPVDPTQGSNQPGIWDGELLQATQTVIDSSGITSNWPTELDTWYSPAIGICPGYFLPDDLVPGSPIAPVRKFQDFGRVLLLDPMLDPDMPKSKLARSIAAVCQSLKSSPYNVWSWDQALYWTAGIAVTGPGVTGPGGTDTKYDPNNTIYTPSEGYIQLDMILCRQPFPDPTNPTITWSDKAVYANGDTVYQLSTGGATVQAPLNSGPGGTAILTVGTVYATFWSQPDLLASGPTPHDAQWWNCKVNKQGGAYVPPGGISSGGYSNNSGYACWWGDLIPAPKFGEHVNWLPGDQFPVPASLPYWDSYWTKLVAVGKHMGVYGGRLDTIYTSNANGQYPMQGIGASLVASDGHDIPLNTFNLKFSSTVPGAGYGASYFTGLDLGELKENDVIMLATDYDTGHVWFGKNGKWYDKDGALPPSEGPAKGTRWVAIMDGTKNSSNPVTKPTGPYDPNTFPPNYYPCVSYRLGPVEMKMLYTSTTIKYAAPSGFKVYGD